MNVYQKSLLGLFVLAYCVVSMVSVIRVHNISTKEIQPDYFIGTIVDKGEENGKSTYRWIIADWTTKDGKSIGRQEINAGGLPINRLKIGDTIRTEASNGKGFFWFNFSCGTAYCPSQLNYYDVIMVIIFQLVLWMTVIIAVILGIGFLFEWLGTLRD